MLTQANYRKFQRTVKLKWNKRVFLISNLEIPIHFLLFLLVSHETVTLVLSVNYVRPQQKLQFFFYVKKYFRMKKRRSQKLMTYLINQVLISFQTSKYTSFAEMNMILISCYKSRELLSFDSWKMRYLSSKFFDSHLLRNFTLIKALFFVMSCFFLALTS